MSRRLIGLGVKDSAAAARAGAATPEFRECTHCHQDWPEERYEWRAGGTPFEICPRCSYTGRFNTENRRAAKAGEILPEWGIWQPAAPLLDYNPFTGGDAAWPSCPGNIDRASLRKAPQGFVLFDDCRRARRIQPEVQPAFNLVPKAEKVPMTMIITEAARLLRAGFGVEDFNVLAAAARALTGERGGGDRS